MSNTGIQRPNWANGITLTNETTAEDVTNYIDFKINEYTKYNFKDKSLWDSYQEDFDNFEVQTFKDADRSAIKRLKQLLRRNGVRTSQLLLRTSRLPLPIIPILSAAFLANLLRRKLHQQRALNASVLLPPLRPLQVTNTTSTESTYWWFYAQRKNCQRWNI